MLLGLLDLQGDPVCVWGGGEGRGLGVGGGGGGSKLARIIKLCVTI